MQNPLVLWEDETIQYQKLTAKYLEEARRVTRQVLFVNGNVCKLLGMTDDQEALSDIDQVPLEAAKDGITVIAVDKNTDKIAGVSINKFLLKSKPFFASFLDKFKTYKARQWLDFLISTHKMFDVFEQCKTDCMIQILFLSVLPEYRKKGIAKKLCELSVDVAQSLQNGKNVKQSVDGSVLGLEPVPDVVYAMFTSFISKKIGTQLGFELGAERSMKTVEIFGQVYENPNVDTPLMTMEYIDLRKRRTDEQNL